MKVEDQRYLLFFSSFLSQIILFLEKRRETGEFSDFNRRYLNDQFTTLEKEINILRSKFNLGQEDNG